MTLIAYTSSYIERNAFGSDIQNKTSSLVVYLCEEYKSTVKACHVGKVVTKHQ